MVNATLNKWNLKWMLTKLLNNESCTKHYSVWPYILTNKTMCVYRNTGARSRNHRCSGKAVSITYSKCVFVALVTQHAKRMRHIILSSVACPVLPYFSTLSHKRHDLRVKDLLNKKRVFRFCPQFLSEIFLIPRRIDWDVTINIYWSSCKVPAIHVRL